MSEKPWHVEGLENCKWVLMDYVDVVLHIFNEETREYYKIEELWEEATSTLVETKY
jgi:ribosome-associated protein